jgi:anti-sigma factor RsiW
MACDEWREKLDAYLDGELAPVDARALSAHMRSCAACSSDALERVQTKRSVSAAGTRYEPSAEFRTSFQAQFAKDTAPKNRSGMRWQWRLVAASAFAVLVFAVALNLYLGRESRSQARLYSELADLHVAALASATPVDVISTDRHTVKPWFQGKIPFAFNLPELQGTEFTLLGGRVTYLAQTPGAHLIYQLRKHEISVFIFQDRGTEAASSTSNSKPAQSLSFNFASWTQNGLRYFVVGDVGASDIEALSKLLRDAR